MDGAVVPFASPRRRGLSRVESFQPADSLHCQNPPRKNRRPPTTRRGRSGPATQAQAGRLVDDLHRRAGRGQRRAGLAPRRHSTACWKSSSSDLWLFGDILPRVLAGCLLGAFIAEILPHEKVSRALGPNSGLKGLADRHRVRRDPAGRAVHGLSGGRSAAHGRRRFRRHHRDGGELDADRLRPRGRLGVADPGHRFHAVADRDLAADPDPGRRARPLRLCPDVSEGRAVE